MPHARSSCLPGLPTQRIQTAPLLFGIANATRRGYILKRVPPDNSHGISSARILARVSSRRGSIRIEGWGPRFWSAASRKLKKNLFPDFTLALFHTVSSEQRSVPRAAAPWFYYTPSLSFFAWWGRGRGRERPWNGLRFCFRFWFSALRLGEGRVIVADTVSLFRYGVFFWQCAVLQQ